MGNRETCSFLCSSSSSGISSSGISERASPAFSPTSITSPSQHSSIQSNSVVLSDELLEKCPCAGGREWVWPRGAVRVSECRLGRVANHRPKEEPLGCVSNPGTRIDHDSGRDGSAAPRRHFVRPASARPQSTCGSTTASSCLRRSSALGGGGNHAWSWKFGYTGGQCKYIELGQQRNHADVLTEPWCQSRGDGLGRGAGRLYRARARDGSGRHGYIRGCRSDGVPCGVDLFLGALCRRLRGAAPRHAARQHRRFRRGFRKVWGLTDIGCAVMAKGQVEVSNV